MDCFLKHTSLGRVGERPSGAVGKCTLIRGSAQWGGGGGGRPLQGGERTI